MSEIRLRGVGFGGVLRCVWLKMGIFDGFHVVCLGNPPFPAEFCTEMVI